MHKNTSFPLAFRNRTQLYNNIIKWLSALWCRSASPGQAVNKGMFHDLYSITRLSNINKCIYMIQFKVTICFYSLSKVMSCPGRLFPVNVNQLVGNLIRDYLLIRNIWPSSTLFFCICWKASLVQIQRPKTFTCQG